ncbi:MAG: 3-methyl-2-oxobutanoate hydroxymethyltransferase [Candidatus Cloacimonetes bacterium]|nr:3-methyl-2-oxobutanoate hydroxymethyltransferase [Candidatus Cloacimonadota bacterium]
MKNSSDLQEMKKKGEKIVMITAYDFSSAKCAEAAGVDTILVGDSLGMVVLGYDNTLKVTIEDMIRHSSAVRRGAPNTHIIVDMPYMSYHVSPIQAKENAARLFLETNANAVKLEGGSPSRLEAIAAIVDCEIPVVAHIGLTPQSVHRFGGYKVQGKEVKDYERIKEEALLTEKAGAFMIVLEGIPEKLGREISESLSIPTIGIGAGRYTDGQVMVYHDILGISDYTFKFVKKYQEISRMITEGIETYSEEVRTGLFPTKKNVYFPENDDLKK